MTAPDHDHLTRASCMRVLRHSSPTGIDAPPPAHQRRIAGFHGQVCNSAPHESGRRGRRAVRCRRPEHNPRLRCLPSFLSSTALMSIKTAWRARLQMMDAVDDIRLCAPKVWR
jgi:hypothetical protein